LASHNNTNSERLKIQSFMLGSYLGVVKGKLNKPCTVDRIVCIRLFFLLMQYIKSTIITPSSSFS
jgi:hypothetical protein